MTERYLAIDLGAESGRVMLGSLEGGNVELEEIHRFRNDPVQMLDTLYWDFPRLWFEIRRGLSMAAERTGGEIDAVAVDSWGVDYGLLDSDGRLVGLPVHYRDSRTEGVMEEVFERHSREELFRETGLQFLSLNTLFQLVAHRRRSPRSLDAADRLLLIADLVSYMLTGRAIAERTLASTTQLLSVRTGAWSGEMLRVAGVPERLFPEIVDAGTPIAPVRADIAREAGFRDRPLVIACGAHDTASAVAAVPAAGERDWAFLSSGTWSLMGVELEKPAITPEVLAHNFTNEAGVGRRVRFLRNINGLWMVQECRRAWSRSGEPGPSYDLLTSEAEIAGDAEAFVDPEDPAFFAPDDMPAAIQAYCRRTGQTVPASRGGIVRAVLESLALVYRRTAEEAARLGGRGIGRLHIVGGGSRNALLNQLTANALQAPVLAGPVEATATGNVLVQAIATGAIASLDELRETVRASCEVREYLPRSAPLWEEKSERFRELTRMSHR